MVVCKYFQQGYCRYGQSCRFEHVYGSKYSYHAPQPTPQSTPAQAVAAVTDDQLVNQVQSDVRAALGGNQWLLSSYAPFKEKALLPGLPDLSPEEARLFVYEAKANNNVEQAIAYMNNLCQDTRSKYEQLLQPSPAIIKVLRSLYKGETVQSPFGSAENAFGSSNTAASSIFRSAVQNTSVFDQTKSNAFGQSSVFGTPDNAAKSIFAQAAQSSQNVFGPPAVNHSVFGASPDNAAKSIFAQANQNAFASPPPNNPSNLFANASQQFFNKPSDPFGQKQGSPLQSTQAGSIFQTQEKPTTDLLGAKSVIEQQATNDSFYSKLEDFTPDDLEAFKSDKFKLGFIPVLPPARELCV